MQSHLDPKYLQRLAAFEQLHPSAFRFLTRVQNSDDQDGLWLSTTTNAQLYKDTAFLAVLKLDSREQRPPSLVLSPKLGNLMAEGTADRSALLFPRFLERLIMAKQGFSSKWAAKRSNGDLELFAKTPDQFFSALYKSLQGLEVAA